MPAYSTTMQTSVTHHGITWNFSTARPVWQYPNGYYGVQRPVTIQSYTPAPATFGGTARNGAMVNPVPGTGNDTLSFKQGFTNDTGAMADASVDYDAVLNYGLSLPYTVPVQATLCNVVYDDSRWDPEKTHFRSMSVLTCLDDIPEAGTLSPPFAGAGLKTVPTTWNENAFHFENFQSKPFPSPLPSDWPTFESAISRLTRRQFDFIPCSSSGTSFKQGDDSNFPSMRYGQQIGQALIDAGILLNHNYSNAEKLPLMRLVAQWGIDIYGLKVAGANWLALGGHNMGRKVAVLLAAAALDDDDMKDALDGSDGVFNEDKTHFFVTTEHISTTKQLVDYTDANGSLGTIGTPARFMSYSSGQEGMADFALSFYDPASTTPQMFFSDTSGGGTGVPVWYNHNGNVFGYRSLNAGIDIPTVYLAQLMGMRATFNNEAYFLYAFNRSVPTYISGYSETIQTLWDRDMGGVEPVVLSRSPGVYEPTQTVSASTGTLGATIRWTNTGVDPNGSSTAYSEPITLSSTVTLKFIAMATGLPPSPVTSAAYTIITNGTPAPPTNLTLS